MTAPLPQPATRDAMPERVKDYEANRRRFGPKVEVLVSRLAVCDPPADALVTWLGQGDGAARRGLFERALAGGLATVPEAPAPLRAFIEAIEEVPPWVDPDRLDAGGRALIRAGALGGMVLGAKSLVFGYCAPAGNKPLVFSGRLQRRAMRRLDETSRFVQAVIEPGGMRRGGAGFAITARVRLMHARVRALLWDSGQWRADLWGQPINQHDMLATVLLFSSVVLRGVRLLGLRPSPAEAEDYMHLWRYVGHVMGVDGDLLPTTEAEAQWLQEVIFHMQGEPDEDSRALVKALLEIPLQIARDPAQREAAQRRVRFSTGLCRGLLGDALADALGLESSAWRHTVPTIARVVGPLEGLRQTVPGLERAAMAAGQHYWREVITLGLRRRPATFEMPGHLEPVGGATA